MDNFNPPSPDIKMSRLRRDFRQSEKTDSVGVNPRGFKIFETSQFVEDIEHLPATRHEQIRKKLTDYVYPQLRIRPYFGKNIKKLKGYKPETWRYRIGAYRFFYGIEERKKFVFMLTVDSRENAY